MDPPISSSERRGDGLTREVVLGSIRIRGRVEYMRYEMPPKEPEGMVSSLFFADTPPKKEPNPNPKQDNGKAKGGKEGKEDRTEFSGCVLDLERRKERNCWALVAATATGGQDFYMIILEERRDESFRRIGICTAYGVQKKEDFVEGRFKERDILIR
jgi:hypothetical protein